MRISFVTLTRPSIVRIGNLLRNNKVVPSSGCIEFFCRGITVPLMRSEHEWFLRFALPAQGEVAAYWHFGAVAGSERPSQGARIIIIIVVI